MAVPAGCDEILDGMAVAPHMTRPSRALVWAPLLALSGIAWLLVVREDGAAVGLMGMSPAEYVGGWLLMTTAMMLPAIAWFGSVYINGIRREAAGVVAPARIASLTSGYLLVWSATALGALALAWAVDAAAERFPDAVPWTGACVLVVAGLYQLSPLKRLCLARCRSPLSFALAAARHHGPLRDSRVGVEHGAWCVACCWALMATLIAVGTMSLAWMVGVTTVVLVERAWRHGERLSRLVGVALVCAGLLVPFVDSIAPALHGGGMVQM